VREHYPFVCACFCSSIHVCDVRHLVFNCSFAVAELQADFNFSTSSKVRAGRVLGRCHAAFWGSTRSRCRHSTRLFSWQVSGASCYQRRWRSEIGCGQGKLRVEVEHTGHWADEHTGKQRVGEMMGRMQGPREPLERLLALPS
jgi:hypothetical protein